MTGAILARARSYHVRTAPNIELHVEEIGDKGPTCVLLHGLAEGGFVWSDFARRLAQDHRVIIIDLRGHGGSSWDENKRYDLETHVDDVDRVIQRLAPDRFILMGHSLGGSVAARLAERRMDLIEALILAEAGPTSNRDAGVQLRSQILESCRPYAAVVQYEAWLGYRRPLVEPAVLSRLAADSLKQVSASRYELRFDPDVTSILAMAMDGEWWLPVLSKLDRPTLVVRGVGSAVLGARLSARMLEVLPQGLLVTVNGAGHAVMTDNPDGFWNAVKPFMQGRPGPGW